jgi:hypothetical protein
MRALRFSSLEGDAADCAASLLEIPNEGCELIGANFRRGWPRKVGVHGAETPAPKYRAEALMVFSPGPLWGPYLLQGYYG